MMREESHWTTNERIINPTFKNPRKQHFGMVLGPPGPAVNAAEG